MGKPIAIIVDWYGPYHSLEEARGNAREEFESGLYMLIGRKKYEKDTKLQYIGIAKNLATRLSNSHPAAVKLEQQIEIWMGEISSAGKPGPKEKETNIGIDLCEWAHAYCLQLPLNEKKKENLPDGMVTLVNRWWQKESTSDNLLPRKKRPHQDWPDVIDFKGENLVDLGYLTRQPNSLRLKHFKTLVFELISTLKNSLSLWKDHRQAHETHVKS